MPVRMPGIMRARQTAAGPLRRSAASAFITVARVSPT
jgi:hypothetical protein